MPGQYADQCVSEAARLCAEVGKRSEPQSFYLLMALYTTPNPTGDFYAHTESRRTCSSTSSKSWIEPSGTAQASPRRGRRVGAAR